MQKVTLTMTKSEVDYLTSLLQDEVFQLSGLETISKIKSLSQKLKVAESIEKKIETAKLVPA